jgi:hypothetical protein
MQSSIRCLRANRASLLLYPEVLLICTKLFLVRMQSPSQQEKQDKAVSIPACHTCLMNDSDTSIDLNNWSLCNPITTNCVSYQQRSHTTPTNKRVPRLQTLTGILRFVIQCKIGLQGSTTNTEKQLYLGSELERCVERLDGANAHANHHCISPFCNSQPGACTRRKQRYSWGGRRL